MTPPNTFVQFFLCETLKPPTCGKGYIEIVKFLYTKIKITEEQVKEVLEYALYNDHKEVYEYLLTIEFV